MEKRTGLQMTLVKDNGEVITVKLQSNGSVKIKPSKTEENENYLFFKRIFEKGRDNE